MAPRSTEHCTSRSALALDWRASAGSMWLAQGTTLLLVTLWGGGGARILSLNELWSALALMFFAQIAAAIIRILSGTGPWRCLKKKD